MSEYFPDLPRFLGVPAGSHLPVYGRRAFSKSVWDIEILGVRGVANLVMNYPRAQAALLGKHTTVLRACRLHVLAVVVFYRLTGLLKVRARE